MIILSQKIGIKFVNKIHQARVIGWGGDCRGQVHIKALAGKISEWNVEDPKKRVNLVKSLI
jgi:hypothetical protein